MAAALIGVAGVAASAGAAPLALGRALGDAVSEAPSEQPARALRGVGSLDRGYPLLRWRRQVATMPSLTRADRDGGVWLRLGHGGERELAAPGEGRLLHARSARMGAPFPLFPLVGGEDFFGQLWMRPGGDIGIHAEYHVVMLGAPPNPWCGVAISERSGAPTSLDDTSAGRRELAHVLGLGLTLGLSEHLGVEAQYGHAFGPAMSAAALSRGAAAHYGYLELTWRY